MSKEEIITAVAVTTDKAMLSRVADIIRHKNTEQSKKPEAETRLITQSEAAKRLSVSNTTVWRLIKEGSLKTVSVRGKRRVQLASLLSFVGVR